MREITVYPDINRVKIYICKKTLESDIELYDENQYFKVFKILGDTSVIDNKELVHYVLDGYHNHYTDIDRFMNNDKMYESHRGYSGSVKYNDHLFPPIELLTIDEYKRNPYRLRNFKLFYDKKWFILADGNICGKGYMLHNSDSYFDCLNYLNNMAGAEYNTATRFYVINDYEQFTYYDDIDAAIDNYMSLFRQHKMCFLGANIQLEDVIYYSNQSADVNLLQSTNDFTNHIYYKSVENQVSFRANPKLIIGINTIVDRLNPGFMLDTSVKNCKITTFSRSFLMADKEKSKGKVI